MKNGKSEKKDILFWQSIGQIVYDMNSGSVNGFRAGPLEQESKVYRVGHMSLNAV